MYNRRSDADDRPWESSGELRRDFEPHRGGFLTVTAGISCILGLGSICFPVLGFIALGLILFVFFAAHRDLAKIQRGSMDPAGERPTKEALPIAFFGMIATLVILLIWVGMTLRVFHVAGSL